VNATTLDTPRGPIERALTGRAVPVMLGLAGWTLLAAIPTTSAYIVVQGQGAALWWRFFKPLVTYYYAWALVTPLIYLMVSRLPITGWRAPWTVLAHVALLVLFSVAATRIHGEAWRDWLYGQHALGYHAMSLFSYALAVLGCVALHAYRTALVREREAATMRLTAARLDGQLNEARIEALRAQINPHFLFNALNSVGALIESQRNDEAYRAIELLGELLRTALAHPGGDDVRLEQEVGFMENYLALEKIRFGSRLNYRSEIDPEARAARIPALLLQPLVENAVKHGVASTGAPVCIELSARLAGEALCIEIDDDGPGPTSSERSPERHHHGLNNVRERLALRFPDRAELAVAPRPGGGTRVTLRIPARDER
jgi:two-component system LytT family sensor kinase